MNQPISPFIFKLRMSQVPEGNPDISLSSETLQRLLVDLKVFPEDK